MIHRLIETLRALSAILTDPDGALLAADEAELAALRARQRQRYTPMLHSNDCPIQACTTCLSAAVADAETPICQPPTHIGRRDCLLTSIAETSNWLREALPEHWCSTDETYLCQIAAWLIDIRQRAEAEGWGAG